MGKSKLITISRELDDKIMSIGVQIFLQHHPEMKGMKFTRNFMIQKLYDFWVQTS